MPLLLYSAAFSFLVRSLSKPARLVLETDLSIFCSNIHHRKCKGTGSMLSDSANALHGHHLRLVKCDIIAENHGLLRCRATAVTKKRTLEMMVRVCLSNTVPVSASSEQPTIQLLNQRPPNKACWRPAAYCNVNHGCSTTIESCCGLFWEAVPSSKAVSEQQSEFAYVQDVITLQ